MAGETVLLVEDNELNRDMLSRRLIRKGYQVVIAETAEDGLAQLRAGLPDIVLMDMSLPGMDGWDAVRVIRAEPAIAGVKVIALTAHAMAADRDRALEAGCDDYDTKPVELSRLLEKMEALIASPRKT